MGATLIALQGQLGTGAIADVAVDCHPTAAPKPQRRAHVSGLDGNVDD